MNKSIEIGLILFVVIGSAYLYGEKRYKHGHDSATAQCQSGINSLQKAINDSNSKAVKLTESQRESYRMALEVRNKDNEIIKSKLESKIAEIEELKNETSNTCVNAPIHDRFK